MDLDLDFHLCVPHMWHRSGMLASIMSMCKARALLQIHCGPIFLLRYAMGLHMSG